MTDTVYGALPSEWGHFCDKLGLMEDLLPVVCRPDAKIHPNSAIKSLGKTPTKYTSEGLVTGIPGWSGYTATRKDCLSWATKRDYGICLQTKRVRAIDIDIPDSALSNAVVEAVCSFLGFSPPKRYREGTGKCLLAVRVPGTSPKSVVHTTGGVVEFLGNGQQFIALGMHASGTKYQWEGGLPDGIPEISENTYTELQDMVQFLFGVEEVKRKEYTPRKTGETVETEDPLASLIMSSDYCIQARKGAIDIVCPWESEHSSPSSDSTATQYLMAGTRGYELGGFKCLHAHCVNRTRNDFMDAMGLTATGMVEVIDDIDTSDTLTVQRAMPDFKRDQKTGEILSTLTNVGNALSNPYFCGFDVAYDNFLGELVFSELGSGLIQPFGDATYVLLRRTLEQKGFKTVEGRMIRDCVELHASQHRIDTAMDWLNGLPEWDGTPRLSDFFTKYIPCEGGTDYTVAVAKYMWSAMAGRILNPGVKADMVPVLISRQGTGKTSMLEALAPHRDRYVGVDLTNRDADLSRVMRGKIVCELAELRGIGVKDWGAVNDFITRCNDVWVPKFKEFTTSYLRRSILIGTGNKKTPFNDPTGLRRWLPLTLIDTAHLDDIRRDRDHIWAEAKQLYLTEGICFRDAENLAPKIHGGFRTVDPWGALLHKYLGTLGEEASTTVLNLQDLGEAVLGITTRELNTNTHARVDGILSGRGWVYDSELMGWTTLK